MKPQQVRVIAGGDIDTSSEGKNAWDSAVRTFVPRLLDISVVNWEGHTAESLKKLRDALDSEFEYVDHPLSMLGFRNAIKRYLKAERGRLKAKYLSGQTACPVHIQAKHWETLKAYWATDSQMAKSARMAKARKQVKKISSIGRGGKAGKEAPVVSELDLCFPSWNLWYAFNKYSVCIILLFFLPKPEADVRMSQRKGNGGSPSITEVATAIQLLEAEEPLQSVSLPTKDLSKPLHLVLQSVLHCTSP
jgi:hypothetical protein